MQAKDVIKLALKSNQDILNMYLADLSDQDLTVRPVPTANNIAWQLGHLITRKWACAPWWRGPRYPELPAGMDEAYDSKTAGAAPPSGYLKKAEYLELFNKVRSATIATVDRMTDADFDKPTTGSMAKWAPTVGALLLFTANHTMMHAGQFTVAAPSAEQADPVLGDKLAACGLVLNRKRCRLSLQCLDPVVHHFTPTSSTTREPMCGIRPSPVIAIL